MSEDSPETAFHSILATRLREYVHGEETPFDAVEIDDENARGRANVVVESETVGSLVIGVEREDAYPLDPEVIRRARDDADATGVDYVATCNSRDFFLFDDTSRSEASDVPYYYLDFRDADVCDSAPNGRVTAILDAVQYLATQGTLPRQSARDRIVGLLRSFHDSIWPTFSALARDAYGTNSRFTDRFDEWVQENDYASLDEESQFSLAAKQYAYLLSNKILFYEVVRERTPDSIRTESGLPLDSLVEERSGTDIERHVERQFEKIQEEIDYEPVFDEGTSLFANYPHDATTRRSIVSLVKSVEAKRLSRIDEDHLGGLYEEFIPESERRALGQFYTHPDIAEAVCNWALQPQNGREVPRVLDPASGSGTFAVEAYHRMQELAPTATHQDVVDEIVAVDVNRFPLHLTALNLASRNVHEKTAELHTFDDSFFDLSPQDGRLPQRGDNGEELGGFDAVVGNPPYVRQENLYPSTEHFRSHLKEYGADSSTPYYSGRNEISKKADAYVYFVTHALQFLREGGRLGFVVPAKWLTTKYGETLQEFLYDQTRVHAVVGFTDRAFTALVDTVLLFVERCGDETERRETVTDFVRVKERLSPETLSSLVSHRRSVPDGKSFDVDVGDEYRVVSVPQDYLEERGGQKLGYYLYGPSPFIPLVDSEKMQRLDAFANVAFGNKTGNNGFFLLDEADVARWDIDDRFLRPAIRSIRNIESLRLAETNRYLLDFDAYVERVKDDLTGLRETSDLTAEVKDQLRADGYHSTLEYLEHGEAEGVPDGRTVSQHTPWFNLGTLHVPEVLHPVFYDERVFTVENAGRFAPTNAIQCVDVTDYEDVLPYVLNSTIYKVMLELWGRHEGGGALQLLTYEVSSVPIPNPEQMSESTRAGVSRAGRRLVEGIEGARDELDEILLEFLELDVSAEELQAAHRGMLRRRTAGAATENVLIRDVADFDDYDLKSSIPER